MIKGSNGFSAMRVSASALSAQRTRMDIFAENIANASTTRTNAGGVYQRKVPIIGQLGDGSVRTFAQALDMELGLTRTDRSHAYTGSLPALGSNEETGVRIEGIERDRAEGPLLYDPSHPDADAAGYVRMPNVEIVQELLSLMGAARAYEANLAAMRTSQEAARETLRIGG